jgi:LPXTG-site transpeptidase (sortase) family protein
MSTGRVRLSSGLAATGAVVLAVGVFVAAGQSGTADAPGVPEAATATGAVAARADDVPATEPVLAPRTPATPRRVLIPGLGVSAPVVPVEAADDTLVPPSDPTRLGWWADGAAPGAQRGSALVAGHTVHTGGGALDDLEELSRGDRVVVRTSRARVVYEVARVRVYDKGRLARDAEQVFSQDVPGRLVLVTCEDWDGSRYLSNVVVVARPVLD